MDEKEKLEKLVNLVVEFAKQPGNKWIIEELQRNLNLKPTGKSDPGIPLEDLYNDLKRSKYFLKYIDGSNWREGFRFYKKIESSDLRLKLSTEFKEMKIAEADLNITEYSRRLVIQLETIFDTLIIKYNAFQIIRDSEMEFIEKDINGKITSNLRRGKYSFFEEDNENNEKSISSIHTGTKLTWIKIYFKINYDYKLWSDINFLRNKASHSSKITEQEKLRLEILQLNFQINQRDFFSFLNKFVKNLESKL
jgi:hypothetical protein